MANSVVTPGIASTDLDAIPRMVTDVRAVFDGGRTRPLAWRLTQLRALERLMVEREAEIGDALASDLGKPMMEVYTGELSLSLADVRSARKNLKKWAREEEVATPMVMKPAKATLVKEPLGVVLIIAPWNYPFQLTVSPLVGALAAGNCVVLKPSEVAPATSALMARLLPQYLDPAAVRIVEGGVPETTKLLEQRWDHIFYTGNGTVGRVVMAAAAKHLTPVVLELGGKSPVYVDPSANLEVAAKRIAMGKFYNCGQTCIAPDYLLVHEAVKPRLLALLAATIREFYGDDPQRSPDYARIVNQRHHQRLMRLLPGSGRAVVGGTGEERDRYIAPTVLDDVPADAPVMADEIFGPILPVLAVRSAEEAISFVNARPKPLALYVFSEESSVADTFIERTSAGGMCVNHCVMHITCEELPFGGVGESGMGAYHGRASFEVFSHTKGVLRKPTFLDPPIAYPPYTARKQAIVKKVL